MPRLIYFMIISVVLSPLIILCGCQFTQQDTSDTGLLIQVHVLTNAPNPNTNYELIEGSPQSIGVYEFYLKTPGIPGSGVFKKLDSIPLEKMNESEYFGKKSIKKIDGTLCIGYPSTNIIDGKAIVRIDQSQSEADITVYYWKTNLGIISK